MPDRLLSLALFGPFEACFQQQPITSFATDKIRSLFAYLAIEADKPHRRETLASLFWPNFADEVALRNLRQSLYRLRRTLQQADPGLPERLISQNPRTVTLHSEWISIDVAQFQTAIQASWAAENPIPHLNRIPVLYRGTLLQGLAILDAYAFNEWLTIQREVLQQQAIEALSRLLGLHEARRDLDAILATAPRLLALEPWHEETHRKLMQAYLDMGNRARAIAQYQELKTLLIEELGTDPSPATTALFTKIKENNTPAAELGLGGLRKSVPPGLLHRSHLPVAITPLIGRQAELDHLIRTLRDPGCRLLTVTGPGGIGKTRLCIEAAHRLAASLDRFSNGIVFVQLSHIEHSSQLVSAVAQSIGLDIRDRTQPQQDLARHLQNQEILFILDNFEHLLQRTGEEPLPPSISFVLNLLTAVPGVAFLVTSRDPLLLQPEWVYLLEGLSYSRPSGTTPADLLEESAPQLFIQIARRYNPAFEPLANAEAILEICRLTDGLPLAIEMAATWLRVYSCKDIARSIAKSLDLLVSPFRDAPPRQRSIRVILDATWDQLSPEQQDTLTALSVFRSDYSIQAALFVTEARVLDLSILIEKSLLRRTVDHRYYQHELVGQFAREKLEAFGQRERVQERHAQFYMSELAEQTKALNGSNPLEGLAGIRQNLDDLRAAWDWAVSRAHLSILETGLRGLTQFWILTGANLEGEASIRKAIAAVRHLSQEARAASTQSFLASSLAWLQMGIGKNEEAEENIQSALALAAAAEDEDRRATALSLHGWLLQHQGHLNDAEAALKEACSIFEAVGNQLELSLALIRMGSLFWWRSMLDRSLEYYERSLQIEQSFGNKRGINRAYGALGMAYMHLERYEQALDYLEKALQSERELGSLPGIVRNLGHLGNILLIRGKYDRAAAYYHEALEIETSSGNKQTSAVWLGNLGRVYTRQNELARALAYYEQSIALSKETGSRYQLSEVLLGKAGIFIRQNRLEEADAFLEEGLAISYELDRKDTILRGMILKARWLSKTGEPEKARQLLESSRETLASEYKESETRARLYYELWKIDGRIEDAQAAHDLYEERLQQVEKIEYTERLQQLKGALIENT